jgi:tetratricopeptide (TPR) repeat protein
VTPVLAKPRQEWDASEKNAVRTLAASLHQLSDIQREQGLAICVDGYQEALSLAQQLSDTQAANICAFNLGHAYKDIPEIRDLSLAAHWYQRSLDMSAKEDRMGRATSLGQLGSVAYERFRETEDANERRSHLSKAAEYYQQALSLIPANAPRELAITHNQLGNILDDAGQLDAALHHYRESIRHKEAMQDRFGAGQTRRNAALVLINAGRFDDALDWAQAALCDFQACDNADREIAKTLRLLEEIESARQATSPPSSAHPPQQH